MSTLSKLTDLPDGHDKIYDDLDKRFTNTWMLLNGTPAFCRGRDGNSVYFIYVNGYEKIWNIVKEPNIDLVPFLPPTGYYNVDGQPLYMYKNPQKQWRRSFCGQIYMNNIGMRMGDTSSSTRRLIKAIFEPVYATLNDIVNPLFVRVALSHYFAIIPDGEIVQLHYRTFPIAKLDFSTMSVEVTTPTMYQEVQDLFKRTGVYRWKMK